MGLGGSGPERFVPWWPLGSRRLLCILTPSGSETKMVACFPLERTGELVLGSYSTVLQLKSRRLHPRLFMALEVAEY